MKIHMKQHNVGGCGKKKDRKRMLDRLRRPLATFLAFTVFTGLAAMDSALKNENTQKIEHRTKQKTLAKDIMQENEEEEEATVKTDKTYEFEYYTNITKTVVDFDTTYMTTEEWSYAFGDSETPMVSTGMCSDTFEITDEYVGDCLGMKYYVVNYEYVKMDYEAVVTASDTSSVLSVIYADATGYEDWFFIDIYYLSPEYDTIQNIRNYVSCLNCERTVERQYFGFLYPDGIHGFSWMINYGCFSRRTDDIENDRDHRTDNKTTKIKIYPNPASDFVFVKPIGTEEEYTIKMFDISGRLVVKDKGRGLITIDTSSFRPGTYLLEIIIGKTKVMKKVHIS